MDSAAEAVQADEMTFAVDQTDLNAAALVRVGQAEQ